MIDWASLELDGEKLRQMTGEDHGPNSLMDLIYAALARNQISARDAVEQILNNPEYGGNREDAESLIEEWSVQIDMAAEQNSLNSK